MDYVQEAKNLIEEFRSYCGADSKWEDDQFEDAKNCALICAKKLSDLELEYYADHGSDNTPDSTHIYNALKDIEFYESVD